MSGETNRLVELARRSADPDARELAADFVSVSKPTIGFTGHGAQSDYVPAVSYTDRRCASRPDSATRILHIDDVNIRGELAAGKVVIVARLQGVDEQGNITTLPAAQTLPGLA
jgi:aspartokinase